MFLRQVAGRTSPRIGQADKLRWQAAMVNRNFVRRWFWLLVPVGYFAAAKLSIAAAVMPEGLVLFWLPNAVLLSAMLLGPRRRIPVIAALGIVAEVAADMPKFSLLEALAFGVANASEAALACLLLKAWRFDVRLGAVADLAKFLVAGPLLGSALAAALGAAAYSLFRGMQTSYLEFMRAWWLGDAIGLLILTPLLLSLASARPPRGSPATGPRWRLADTLVASLCALLTVVLVAVPGAKLLGLHVAPVLLMPCVLYLAARLDMRWVSAMVGLVSLALAYAAVQGQLPFGVLSPKLATGLVQQFVLSLSLIGLGLCTLLGQLRDQRKALLVANQRLDEANRTLQRRLVEGEAHARQLEALLGERTQMLDVLAHEVRQPLNNASAALQSAQGGLRGTPDGPASERVARAQVVLGQVMSSIDNTLAVTSLLAGREAIQRDDTDLDTLVDVVVADLALSDRKRVRVLRDTTTRTAVMDMSLARLALRNLLINATKFSAPGSEVQVRISDSDAPPALLIDVSDHGPGVAAEVLPRLFSRGARGSTANAGHGLGLYIVQRVMALHGGTAQLLHTGQDGCTVRLTFAQTDAAG